jgi:hypothetical protein
MEKAYHVAAIAGETLLFVLGGLLLLAAAGAML